MYKWHTNAETHVLRIGCLARTFTGFLAWLIHDSKLGVNSVDTPLSLVVLYFFFFPLFFSFSIFYEFLGITIMGR